MPGDQGCAAGIVASASSVSVATPLGSSPSMPIESAVDQYARFGKPWSLNDAPIAPTNDGTSPAARRRAKFLGKPPVSQQIRSSDAGWVFPSRSSITRGFARQERLVVVEPRGDGVQRVSR